MYTFQCNLLNCYKANKVLLWYQVCCIKDPLTYIMHENILAVKHTLYNIHSVCQVKTTFYATVVCTSSYVCDEWVSCMPIIVFSRKCWFHGWLHRYCHQPLAVCMLSNFGEFQTHVALLDTTLSSLPIQFNILMHNKSRIVYWNILDWIIEYNNTKYMQVTLYWNNYTSK